MGKKFEITCNWCGMPEADKIHTCSDCGEDITENMCDKYEGLCRECKEDYT